MKITKLGKYKTRDGKVVTIDKHDLTDVDGYYWQGRRLVTSDVPLEWTDNGYYYNNQPYEADEDIVEYLGPLEENESQVTQQTSESNFNKQEQVYLLYYRYDTGVSHIESVHRSRESAIHYANKQGWTLDKYYIHNHWVENHTSGV